MKPGEFVRWNGRSVRALMIQCRYQDGYEAIIGPDSPDYALAVAALLSDRAEMQAEIYRLRAALERRDCTVCECPKDLQKAAHEIERLRAALGRTVAAERMVTPDWVSGYERASVLEEARVALEGDSHA